MATIEIGGKSFNVRMLSCDDIDKVFEMLPEVGIEPLKADIVDIFESYPGGFEGVFTDEGHLLGMSLKNMCNACISYSFHIL